MVKSMLEIITSMLEMLSSMSEILVPTLWLCFVAYAAWYYISAKKYAPLTRKEVKILWKLHKQNVGCKAKKWDEIRRKDKIIGFKCECGHKHVQKRPIAASTPASHVGHVSPVFYKMHTTYESE
jgi:hypothetical protein